MARVVNEQEFKARRNQILDVAQKLIYTQGYEQMSIQDILEDLKISKGAFYHYFGSKPDLLEALSGHLMEEAVQLATTIFQDPGLTPLEKLRRWFDVSTAWKKSQKTYLLALVRGWYADDNAILRQKMLSKEIKLLSPMIADVLHQGTCQAEFNTPYPEQAAEMLFYLFQGLGEKFSEYLLDMDGKDDSVLRSEIVTSMGISLRAYSDAIERILGARPGSLLLMDTESSQDWFTQ